MEEIHTTTPFVDVLHNDVLVVIAGYLVSPYDFYALARTSRHLRRVLLTLYPDLVRRMEVMYFRPWRNLTPTYFQFYIGSNAEGLCHRAYDILEDLPVLTPEVCTEAARRFPYMLEALAFSTRGCPMTEATVLAAIGTPGNTRMRDGTFHWIPPWLLTAAVCRAAVNVDWKLYPACPAVLRRKVAFQHFAVKRCGLALQWMKGWQTPELVEAAINSDGLALQYVEPPLITSALVALAIERDPRALQSVPAAFHSEALWLRAVTLSSFALKYVPVQTAAICEAAVRSCWHVFREVKNPTNKCRQLYEKGKRKEAKVVVARYDAAAKRLEERIVARRGDVEDMALMPREEYHMRWLQQNPAYLTDTIAETEDF